MVIFRAYRKIGIFPKIVGGFAIGIILGIVLGETAAHLQFLGTIMVRLLTMVVIPLVVSMMVVAVGNVGAKAMGKMGILATLLFTFSTPVAIAIGLTFAFWLNVGYGVPAPVDIDPTATAAAPTFIETVVNIIPNNIFQALATADLLQVMTFSILIGIAISALPNKDHQKLLIDLFQAFGDVMQKILAMAMGIMPIGVMGIIAWLVGTSGIQALQPFIAFIVAIYLMCLFVFILHICLARFLGGVKFIDYLKAAKEPLVFSYATNSSFATLPLVLAAAKKLGVKDRVANFVIPYGIVVNMDGSAAYIAMATVFIANVYGIDIGLIDIIMITLSATLGSFGAAGVPGAAVVMLNAVLLMLGFPLEAVALLIGFDRLLIGPVRAFLNVNGDFAVALIVDRFAGGNDEEDEPQFATNVVAATSEAEVNNT